MGFQPGVITNPNGRPKGGLTFAGWKNVIDNVLDDYEVHEIVDLSKKIEAGVKVPVASRPAMAVKVLGAVYGGDVVALERLLDRFIGKPTQPVAMVSPSVSATLAGLEMLEDDDLSVVLDGLEAIKAKRARPAIAAPAVSTESAKDDPG